MEHRPRKVRARMRTLAPLIAGRYLWGKRGANAAPLLSRISMLALAVGSAAMIILFSVFNGFESVIGDLYTAFYSDVRITPAAGKFFALDPVKYEAVRKTGGIESISAVIEDNALVHTEEEQVVVTLKGIDSNYFRVNKLSPYIVQGRDSVHEGALPTAILGIHVAARLGLTVDNDFSRLTVNYPNSKVDNVVLNPTEAYQTLELKPDGIFKVQEEFDERYVLASLGLVQTLFSEEGKWSSLEIRLKQGADARTVQRELRRVLGKDFTVETRYEQNHTLNSVMKTEKWATYAILLFVLLIASVNMIGAMSLLVLEKGKDMAILSAMGLRRRTVRAVFLLEGMLWAAVGGGIGILIGALVCAGQQRWGWVSLNGDFIIQAYPVKMMGSDFVVIGLTVLGVGLLAALYPALKAAPKARKESMGVLEGLR